MHRGVMKSSSSQYCRGDDPRLQHILSGLSRVLGAPVANDGALSVDIRDMGTEPASLQEQQWLNGTDVI